MRAFLLSIASVLATAGAVRPTRAQGLPADSAGFFRRLGALTEQRRTRDSVPALQVAVVRGGRLVWSEAFGTADLANGARATVTTPFAMGSIAKPITATALMSLVQQRRLRLDQPANLFLGDARITLHGFPEVTVRALASHGSGISRHDLFDYATDSTPGPSLAERARRYAHAVRPIGSYEYSNLNYMLLAAIIARVSGTSYADYLQRAVFRPLGMMHSTVGEPATGVAVSYLDNRQPAGLREASQAGAGGFFSTAEDLARFGAFHAGSLTPSQPPVNRAWLDSMHTPQTQFGVGMWYDLGLRTDSATFRVPMLMHTGSNGASASVLLIVPALDLVVAAVSNSVSELPGWVAGEVVGAFGGRRPAMKSTARPTAVPADPFAPRAFHTTREWAGVWSGDVTTPDGAVPVTIRIADGDSIFVILGDASPVRASGVRLEAGFLRGTVQAELATGDTRGRRYRLNFRLLRAGNRLTGALTASSAPGERIFTLSHYMALERTQTGRQ